MAGARRATPRGAPSRDAVPAGAMGAGWVVGAKSVLRAMAEGARPPYVVVAADAPGELVAQVVERAGSLSVPVVEVASAAGLGATCGVSRPVAAAMPPCAEPGDAAGAGDRRR